MRVETPLPLGACIIRPAWVGIEIHGFSRDAHLQTFGAVRHWVTVEGGFAWVLSYDLFADLVLIASEPLRAVPPKKIVACHPSGLTDDYG